MQVLSYREIAVRLPSDVGSLYATPMEFEFTIEHLLSLLAREYTYLPFRHNVQLQSYIATIAVSILTSRNAIENGARVPFSQTEIDILFTAIVVRAYSMSPNVVLITPLVEISNQIGVYASDRIIAVLELLNSVLTTARDANGGMAPAEIITATNRIAYIILPLIVDEDLTMQRITQHICPVLSHMRAGGDATFSITTKFLARLVNRLAISYMQPLANIEFDGIRNEHQLTNTILFKILELAEVPNGTMPHTMAELGNRMFADANEMEDRIFNCIHSLGIRISDDQALLTFVLAAPLYRQIRDEYEFFIANQRTAFKAAIIAGVDARTAALVNPLPAMNIQDIDNFYTAIEDHIRAHVVNPRNLINEIVAAQPQPYPFVVRLTPYPFH